MLEAREISWNGHSGTVLDTMNGFDIIECRQCAFAHCVPIPSADQLAQTYKEEYYSVEKPLYFKNMEKDLEWWRLSYADRFDTFEKVLEPKRRRILDIGSGPGYFLQQAKERGWSTLGIEPSRQAAEYSRKMGIEIIEEFFTVDIAQTIGQFDAVHMSEALEHIPDPASMLQLVHKCLSPKGVLCVVVPNDYNPFQQALRKAMGFKPWWVAAPHHLNYFNFHSIRKLFDRAGFEVIGLESTFPIDLFLLFGDNYVGNDEIGRASHTRRKNFELYLNAAGLNELKRKLYSTLASLELGREIVAFGVKGD